MMINENMPISVYPLFFLTAETNSRRHCTEESSVTLPLAKEQMEKMCQKQKIGKPISAKRMEQLSQKLQSGQNHVKKEVWNNYPKI
jgi:anti-sigma28 factor (negative regulator of flagellin synthesis)